MTIYIAAPWIHRPDALTAKQMFEAAGFIVEADWITRQTDEGLSERYLAGITSPDDEHVLQREAVVDYKQATSCDAFVILNYAKSEGKATELGFAVRERDSFGSPRIVLVGPRTINIFYHLPSVEQVFSVEDAVRKLQGKTYRIN